MPTRTPGSSSTSRLDGLNARDGRARLAIGFHDPAELGIGLGRETVRLVLAHAFDTLELHRVDLRVLDYNARATRCYESCGFVVEGREREAALIDGVRHDWSAPREMVLPEVWL